MTGGWFPTTADTQGIVHLTSCLILPLLPPIALYIYRNSRALDYFEVICDILWSGFKEFLTSESTCLGMPGWRWWPNCIIKRVSEIGELQGKSLRHTNYRHGDLKVMDEILCDRSHLWREKKKKAFWSWLLDWNTIIPRKEELMDGMQVMSSRVHCNFKHCGTLIIGFWNARGYCTDVV